MMEQALEESKYETIDAVKRSLRFGIVFITWVIVLTSSKSFFQSACIASIASLYEYIITFLDSRRGVSRVISAIGCWVSGIWLVFSFFGLNNFIAINTDDFLFHFNKSVPIPDATNVSWSFYWVIIPLFLLPTVAIIELFIKPEPKRVQNRAQSKQMAG